MEDSRNVVIAAAEHSENKETTRSLGKLLSVNCIRQVTGCTRQGVEGEVVGDACCDIRIHLVRVIPHKR